MPSLLVVALYVAIYRITFVNLSVIEIIYIRLYTFTSCISTMYRGKHFQNKFYKLVQQFGRDSVTR